MFGNLILSFYLANTGTIQKSRNFISNGSHLGCDSNCDKIPTNVLVVEKKGLNIIAFQTNLERRLNEFTVLAIVSIKLSVIT